MFDECSLSVRTWIYIAVQGQKTVTAFLKSKQLLPFDFGRQLTQDTLSIPSSLSCAKLSAAKLSLNPSCRGFIHFTARRLAFSMRRYEDDAHWIVSDYNLHSPRS